MSNSSNSAPLKPAVFLDRDGTLNQDKGYTYLWNDWAWLPGALEALELLRGRGYTLVVVTNQAGVARGLYTTCAVEDLHGQVQKDLEKRGLRIDAFYYCPHHPDFTGPCSCRKPNPGMIEAAAKELGLDLSRSHMVGDKLSDIMAGLNAQVDTILVLTGYGRTVNPIPKGVRVCEDILAAAKLIVQNDK
ncbi:MAG: D-glycero-beta-D-manno-heptose 1,7-bisphosphate 7-phosphatase [Deltaproteobacteria bacterium]|jgi:D-glycero-D-manno-heptose 1,7-bisphosphate phosphatase|nr:D-glycero-beta-D-manno-heptose 1,7-bisphosphate 7-phosphatase [Deltaproteobacteria bacterium]